MHTGGRGLWYTCLRSCFACLWELDRPSFIHLICFVISHVANKSHLPYRLMFPFTSYHSSTAWGILGCVFLWTWGISSGKSYRTSVSHNLKEKNIKLYFLLTLTWNLAFALTMKAAMASGSVRSAVPPKAVGVQFQITLQLLKVSQNIVRSISTSKLQ